VDVYFDNVGGPISDAVTNQINEYGRISLCGQISVYNEDDENPKLSTGPRLDWVLLTRNARKEGFIVSRPAWVKQFPEALAQMAAWVGEGKVKVRETVLEGLDNAPKAFLSLFDGSNTGKMVVKVSPDAQ
jgi:NADPH-dependent curcumin reductase CurA